MGNKYLWNAGDLTITRAKGAPRDGITESGRENSVAMVLVPGDPPGKNVSSFLRALAVDRSRLIVVGVRQVGRPGSFERMLRASLPDCDRKIRVIEADSVVEAINSAEKNRHYRPSQALEVFCDHAAAEAFSRDRAAGRLDIDPTVISVRPVRIPSDDPADITRAVSSDDETAMHRVLDPHLFSDAAALADYRSALSTEGVIREFLSDIAPSRDLAIRHLDDLLARELGDSHRDLQYLGTGRNGSAYRSPDGLIMKVTTDPIEARAAGVLAGHTTDHLGEIYAIFPLEEGIWLIVQEDLAELPVGLREELDLAVEVLEAAGGLDFLNSGDFPRALSSLMEFTRVERGLAAMALDAMQRFDVADMCYELSTFGLTGDFHSGNVRLRGDRPVLTDLGTPGADVGMVREFGTGGPGSGANGPVTMRGGNSSSWSSGGGALKQPQNHVPEDDNESERDRALDWGPGRVSGASA